MSRNHDHSVSLVKNILIGGPIEPADALLKLIASIADPQGDKEKYELAMNAIREVYPHTRHFEDSLQSLLDDDLAA